METNQTPQVQPTPAEQPVQPAPQQPVEQPAEQPAPQQPADPFATLFSEEPAQPVQPPVEQTPPAQPTQTEQPPEQPTPQPAEDNDYIESLIAGIDKPSDVPKVEEVNADDPAAIQEFFNKFAQSIQDKARYEAKVEAAIQRKETQLWDEAFTQYPSLRKNRTARDLVHRIRVGSITAGKYMTPRAAADALITSLNKEYQRGIVDNQVVTTIENVQPNNGGGTSVVSSDMTERDILKHIQEGGEEALIGILDKDVKAGRL